MRQESDLVAGRRAAVVSGLALLVVSWGACGLHEPSSAQALVESENRLAGTSWRLVQFQSMDDAVGTVRPEDSRVYTMTLSSDGTVAMQLDCNRGTGTWSAEAAGDGSSGTFTFGPLAMTRALCPPSNLDERIAADAEYVRGYLLRDGQLHLSLMADGGIWTWEPLSEEPFLRTPDADLESAIREASPDYNSAVVGPTGGTARYLYGRVDLNGDGRDEVFAYLLGPFFCGTGGCTLLLFTDTEQGFTLINTFPISRLPIIVSPETTEGWQDLVRPESGGGAEPSFVTHVFDGERYVERDRQPATAEPQGRRYLAGGFTFEDGIPLPLPGG